MRRIISLQYFMHIRCLLCAIALASVALPSGWAAAADDVPLDESTSGATEQEEPWRSPAWTGIQIERVIAVGNGCPEGSFRGYLSNGGQQFNIRFVGFVPDITPRYESVRGRCRLSIYVRVPDGVQYEVQKFSYVGYAALDKGVSADVAARYYFDADGARFEEVRTTFRGPFDDTFTIEDKPTAEGIWSPCGGRAAQLLNVELEVLLRNGSPYGYGLVDIEESVGMALRYRSCR